MESSIFTIACFSAIWSSLYFFLCIVNPKRSYEWHCRLVTALHAITVCILSAWCAFVQGPWPFTDMVSPTTPLQNTTIMVCLGYFFFDLAWCIYFQTEGPVMMLHHMISIIGMSVGVMTGHYGTEMIATIFGSEITNPLLQLRWFLRETKNHKSLIGDIIDHAFMFAFGFFRIGIGSCLLYSYFRQDTDYLGRLGASVIYGISWLFWINIVQYAIKKYKRRFLHKVENSDAKTNGHSKDDCSANADSVKATSNGYIPKSDLSNGHLVNKVNSDEISNVIHRNGNYVKIDKCDEIRSNDTEDGSHLRQRYHIDTDIHKGGIPTLADVLH